MKKNLIKEERNLAVRRLSARGVSNKDISKRLGVTYGTVWNIINNYPHSKQKEMKALETKGEKHYKNGSIEPVEYILKNKMGYLEGNVIKYVTRHRDKGKSQDIKKAIHYLEMILEAEYHEA